MEGPSLPALERRHEVFLRVGYSRVSLGTKIHAAKDSVTVLLRGLPDCRIFRFFVGLEDYFRLVVSFFSHVEPEVVLLVVGCCIARLEALPLGRVTGLLSDLVPWHRVRELFKDFVRDAGHHHS